MLQWTEIFQHFSEEITKMESLLRSAQFLKQEAEELQYQGKEVVENVKQETSLHREERAAWIDAQKVQAEIWMAKIQAKAEGN